MQVQHPIPISHPDYIYPSSNNPYWKGLHRFRGLVFSDNETEKHPGSWRNLPPRGFDPSISSTEGPAKEGFSNQRELHVEIGCNAGHVILEWAALHPERTYIGLDWKFKAIFRGAEKAEKRGLRNLCFLRAHAERLKYIFGPHEIDALYLFFPDPWPKKSQKKNRFFTEARLREIAELMKPGGLFQIKTDHPDYFDGMLEAASRVTDQWEIAQISRNLHEGHPDPKQLKIPDVTLFERLFIKDGIPIQSLKLKARA